MSCIHTKPPRVYDEGWALGDYGPLGEELQKAVENPKQALQKKKGFLIYGPTGVGKSSVAWCFHDALVRQKKLARWVECAMIPGNPIEAEDLLEELMSESALVVIFDDLGQEPAHIRSRLGKVLTARALMPNRLDVITTNLNVNVDDEDACEVKELYGAHVRSRLWKMCRGGIVEFNGVDHRTTS